jgi:FMN phosphatase YigB (HAD superfamily)
LFWSQLSDSSHKYHKYFKKITKTVFNSDVNLVEDWMRGNYSAEHIAEIININTGLDQSIIFDELKKSCENMQFVSSKISQLITSIRKKGIKVGIATDNMDTFLRFTVPAMNLSNLFDDFLVSSSLGFLKKDHKNSKPYFFQKFLIEKKLDYSDLLLIDDSSDINELYEKVGLKVLNIKNSKNLENILIKYAA